MWNGVSTVCESSHALRSSAVRMSRRGVPAVSWHRRISEWNFDDSAECTQIRGNACSIKLFGYASWTSRNRVIEIPICTNNFPMPYKSSGIRDPQPTVSELWAWTRQPYCWPPLRHSPRLLLFRLHKWRPTLSVSSVDSCLWASTSIRTNVINADECTIREALVLNDKR